MIPICPDCGHQQYYAGEVIIRDKKYRQYMCVYCDHIEYWMIPEEPERGEFVL